MDFLDPKKQKLHHRYLLFGYAFTTMGVILATTILLFLAYGFGINKSGEVVQNGLIFVSSSPGGANIFVDGKQRSEKTNNRLLLENGSYTLKVEKTDYRPWERAISVNGGVVERFDYPLLVPKNLKTTTEKTFASVIPFATQSRDRRWVLTQSPNAVNEFTLQDINNTDQQPVILDVPETALSGGITQSWALAEWSTDNRRVLLVRTYVSVGTTDSTIEYVLLDREKPSESISVSRTLQSGTSIVSLVDGKFDQYYVLNTTNAILSRASVDQPALQTVLENVQAFKSYSDDKILYSAPALEGAETSQVKLLDGETTYNITDVPKNDTYFLDIARHDGAWYVVAGAQSTGRVSVYKNPIESITQLPKQPLVPVQVLKVDGPVSVSFSANTRFVMATNGAQFYVYDIQNDKGHRYTAKEPLDAPQISAQWMDGHRLMYVSGGKLLIFDYDYTNKQSLQTADPAFLPFFERDYRYVYSFAKEPATVESEAYSLFQETPLRLPADL